MEGGEGSGDAASASVWLEEGRKTDVLVPPPARSKNWRGRGWSGKLSNKSSSLQKGRWCSLGYLLLSVCCRFRGSLFTSWTPYRNVRRWAEEHGSCMAQAAWSKETPLPLSSLPVLSSLLPSNNLGDWEIGVRCYISSVRVTGYLSELTH